MLRPKCASFGICSYKSEKHLIEFLATARMKPDKIIGGLLDFCSMRWFLCQPDLLLCCGSGRINDSLQELGCGALLEGCKPLDKGQRRHASFYMICSRHQQDLSNMVYGSAHCRSFMKHLRFTDGRRRKMDG